MDTPVLVVWVGSAVVVFALVSVISVLSLEAAGLRQPQRGMLPDASADEACCWWVRRLFSRCWCVVGRRKVGGLRGSRLPLKRSRPAAADKAVVQAAAVAILHGGGGGDGNVCWRLRWLFIAVLDCVVGKGTSYWIVASRLIVFAVDAVAPVAALTCLKCFW